MGGSGGGYFKSESPEKIRDALREEEQTTENQIFETEVSSDLADLLDDYNNRDVEGVRRAIEEVKRALENEVEDLTISPIFGGSVRKHTYVDGVSDIDSLLVLKGEGAGSLNPAQALDFFEATVRDHLPNAEVERDRMSVTIHRDGLTLQILPAIRRHGELFIPSSSTDSWSKIRPEAFIGKLTEVNDGNGGMVVPTIKIVKGMNDSFPENQRLSGYHVESLAIEAFKNYQGPRNTKAMVEHFVGFAADRVLSPIRDKTGQSVHVDGYAGAKDSDRRRLMAQNLDRVWRKMKNANATHSRDKWRGLLNQVNQ